MTKYNSKLVQLYKFLSIYNLEIQQIPQFHKNMNLQPYQHNYNPIKNINPYLTPANYIQKNQKSSKINQQTHNSRQNSYSNYQHNNIPNVIFSKSPNQSKKQSQILIYKMNSAKNLQNRTRDSNLCQNYHNYKFYQTQKTIKDDLQVNKMNVLYETSSTIKDFQNIPLIWKNSFHPKNNKSRIQGMIFKKKINGDSFDIIKPIGKGKYGKVFLVLEKQTGFLLALKAIQKQKLIKSNLIQQFIRQVKIQFYLNHPGIIKLYGFFDDSQNIYLLMQLGCDGQLYDKISDKSLLSQQSASFVAKSMLEVVDYMHQEKVLHRDIKHQNIVLILGHLKICDLGWAVYNNTKMRTTFCGTPLYFSPQLLSKQEYDQKVDLWAIGVMIYELVIGKSPFNLKQHKDLGRIITDDVQFPKNLPISQEFKNFIYKILQKNPQKRPSSRHLLKSTFIKHYQNIQICQQLCQKCSNTKKQTGKLKKGKAKF